MHSPKITLVIPHYPSEQTDIALDVCLKSFEGQYDELILVVNDGIGYGPAVNWGLKYSTGDYIIVSNNDVILTHGDVKALTYGDGFVIPIIQPMPRDYKPRSIFCMSRKIYETILNRDGFFYDPRFKIGYFEDDDLHNRTIDIQYFQSQMVHVSHLNGGGLTMKQMGEQEWFDKNQEVFKNKWS